MIMGQNSDIRSNKFIKPFDRKSYNKEDDFTYIGDGKLGGKATGMAFIKENIVSKYANGEYAPFTVNIPQMTVITTKYFDLFMEQNDLYEVALSNIRDERMTHHFLKADLPIDLIGDLRLLISSVNTPLAIRSSSLLEDSLNSPFAGVYETKMIPNNQPDTETRFRNLVEAIKFVYSSTFFKGAKSYMESVSQDLKKEKMAIIIQEVVGLRHSDRFYPNISGVARSYNYYPIEPASPEDGIINLALGLGKSIVEGGSVWSYSPEYPHISPPYSSVDQLMKQTQLDFWSVNMGKPPEFNPAKETEYLMKSSLKDAEYDNTLIHTASTYDYENDRVNMGIGNPGPRIINFAPVLQIDTLPVNGLIKSVLKLCEDVFDERVEIEFALTINKNKDIAPQFGLLQVRPMARSGDTIEISDDELNGDNVLVVSDNVVGNGQIDDISDIVFVDPDTFHFKHSRDTAYEIDLINRKLTSEKKPFLLIGFGRWGSSDPWLGIPVDWGHISGVRGIIECKLPGTYIDFSQGSHFFHNMSNLGILYFTIDEKNHSPIDWQWLQAQEIKTQSKYTKHICLKSPLILKVDGRNRKGVILK